MVLRLTLVTALIAVLTVVVMNREPEELPPATVHGMPGAEATPQVTGIDSVLLLQHLSALAHDSMQGREVATEGAERARRYLLAALSDAGVEPMGSSYEVDFRLPDGRTGVNLVGRVAGSDGIAPPVIVLTAHYDHEGIIDGDVYNGADDNASGVATVLEIARALGEQPTRHPVVVALFDAEETGLLGARAFVASPPLPLSDMALNVNLDMVSRANGLLWAAGAFHTPALRQPLEAAASTAPLELRLGHDSPGAPEGADWTSQSDQGAFHARGIPFVYFGVDDHPDYHRPTDDVERIDPGDFVNSARTILSALRALDATLPLP